MFGNDFLGGMAVVCCVLVVNRPFRIIRSAISSSTVEVEVGKRQDQSSQMVPIIVP